MPFTTSIPTVCTPDGRNLHLLEPIIYAALNGSVITVPAGFHSDGASVPRALWPAVAPFGRHWRAAILHDYLYRETYLPKSYCDQIFLEAMTSDGVDQVTRTLIYDTVVAAGGPAFHADRLALDQKTNAERLKG